MNDEVNPADLPLLLRGSVQPGDYLTSNVANRLLYAAADYIESKLADARAAHDELISTADELAALSPVGQEPVVFISPDDLGDLRMAAFNAVRSDYSDRPERYTMPLYAAPPAAQAVDLEQFRESVERIKGHAAYLRDRYAISTQARVSCDDLVAECDRLIALIDQQAGKGVRHG